MKAWMQELRKQILEQLNMKEELSDEALLDVIDNQIQSYAGERLLTLGQRSFIQQQLFHSFRKLDVLQELLERPGITEIMVNGTQGIFFEQDGELFAWERQFDSLDKLENVVHQIVALGNKTINEAEPIVDTRLSDGSRVNIVMPPATIDGPCITIRRFCKRIMSLEQLVHCGSISQEIKEFLELLVRSGYNLFVSGGTGSGKTTFLNALSQAIPSKERVITIEDSAELQLQGIENLVRMEVRPANGNGVFGIDIRQLIRTALRMRPDRIIVGEVRGPEALDLLQANNTGHDGGMSTGHANSCQDMLQRLEVMTLMAMDLPMAAVRGQIAAGFDLFIHLGRLRDKSRKVLQICEVTGVTEGQIQLRSLYEFQEQPSEFHDGRLHGAWVRVGRLTRTEKLKNAGLDTELRMLYGEAVL